MKVLITGAAGQLGYELQRTASPHIEYVAVDRNALDITDQAAIERVLDQHRPQVIVNAAAYTAVDKAEQDRERAHAGNVDGPAALAMASAERGLRLIHVSTDFVFDGNKSQPYSPDDRPNPLGVYGATKLEGERRVLKAAAANALILRTGWVYSAHGHNFVKTMLRLMSERDVVNVVADQVGTPTWAHGLAGAIWRFAEESRLAGIYHWSDAGVASWYDFAVAIHDEARRIGLLRKDIPIRPIRTADYPTPAMRPPYSVLDKATTWSALGIEPVHWREALRAMLGELRDAGY